MLAVTSIEDLINELLDNMGSVSKTDHATSHKKNRPGKNKFEIPGAKSITGRVTQKEYDMIKEVAAANNFKFYQLLNPFIKLILRYKKKLTNFKSFEELDEFVNRLALIEV